MTWLKLPTIKVASNVFDPAGNAHSFGITSTEKNDDEGIPEKLSCSEDQHDVVFI